MAGKELALIVSCLQHHPHPPLVSSICCTPVSCSCAPVKQGKLFLQLTVLPEARTQCSWFPLQVMGKVPTISINKTDGCHVYLSKNSLDCEIVSAKSSEMNVLIPTEGGDFNEFPVPEQFKTLWSGQKLVTTVTEIAG